MKPVFLDRDGVISIFTPDDYIKKWSEFEFLPTAFEGLKNLQKMDLILLLFQIRQG